MIAHTHTRALAAALMFAVAGSLFVAQPAHAGLNDEPGSRPDPIVGTWLTTVTPDGPDAPPPFPQLLTFNEGGTLMQSAAGPPIPALGNPGHGAWKRVGKHTIATTFAQLTFDETLQQNGSLKVSTLVTLHEQTHTITSVNQATIYDLDGNEIVTLTATETGRRLFVQRPH